VVIGGDSAGVAGWSITTRADEKVFHVGARYLMGFTSSFRMGQLLRYRLEVPDVPDAWDLDRWMSTIFVDAVRDCLKEGGYAKVENNEETGGGFLVGVEGHLYEVGCDYQIGRSASGYLAIGCGDDLALGSLHTTARYAIAPTDRALMALEAAAHLSGGVAPPFVIENQPA
jgi:hypothetical protein